MFRLGRVILLPAWNLISFAHPFLTFSLCPFLLDFFFYAFCKRSEGLEVMVYAEGRCALWRVDWGG